MTAKKRPAVTAAEATPSRVVRLSKIKKTAAAIAAGDYSDISDRDVAALDLARKVGLLPVPADYEETAMAKANAVYRATPAPEILQSVADHIAERTAAGETSILALTPEQQEIVDLMGQLRDSEAAHTRDLTALRTDLDAADLRYEVDMTSLRRDLSNADILLKQAEGERDDARAQRDTRAASNRELALKLANSDISISELGSELDAAEDRIGHLERALAHAQRGWIAKLFRHTASGSA